MAEWMFKLPGDLINGTLDIFRSASPMARNAVKEIVVHVPKPFILSDFAASYQASPWIKVAAISGGMAVCMSAYHAHKMSHKDVNKRNIFATGLQQHYHHTLALLIVPLVRRTNLTGTLFLTGILVFCGTCYVTAAYEEEQVTKYTPFGGFAFILGWLSIIF